MAAESLGFSVRSPDAGYRLWRRWVAVYGGYVAVVNKSLVIRHRYFHNLKTHPTLYYRVLIIIPLLLPALPTLTTTLG